MKQITNTKNQYHFKRWTEITTNDNGEKYTIKICSDRNAKKNGDLCGREVLKEIHLTNEEFRTLSSDLHCYESTKQKLRILATKHYNPSHLDETLEGFKKSVEWILNKNFEDMPFMYVNSNKYKFNISKIEQEQLRKFYHEFCDEYEFEVVIRKK